MTDSVNCFVAYPSSPPALSEVIEKAIARINTEGEGIVVVQGWKELSVSGKLIINEVCSAIDKSQLFICDLTYLNPNVLFELGYAIAHNKQIWITLDTSYDEAKQNYDKFSLLRGVGYAGYQNADHLTNLFFQQQPYNINAETIYSKIINSSNSMRMHQHSILYLKSRIETQASIDLSRLVKNSKIQAIVDDPHENNSQPLAWYVQNTRNSEAAIIHLLDDKRDARNPQNGKYSFVAGLALGFNNSILMLAHAKHYSPIDYSDLLYVHETSDECVLKASKWLETLKGYLADEDKKLREHVRSVETKIALRNLYLGEDIAENEEYNLMEYFIETTSYKDALNVSQSMIYVGRKGSGKTANLYKISHTLDSDRRNHVCLIKPVGYELEGVVRLLELKLARAEQGFMLESLWKFLIYTELAKSVFSEIENNIHGGQSKAEVEFARYVDEHRELITPDFAVRMENAINRLIAIDSSNSLEKQEAKVSEILHTAILSHLRELLGVVLEGKEKVFVLIDNLDKSWIRGSDIRLLSDFLFALLSVSRIVTEEYNKARSRRKPVRLSLIVFLRSDIFSYIMRVARERDKLVYRRLEWTDPVLLQRIIEERFLEALHREFLPEAVWERFFTKAVDGLLTKDYIVKKIIPRPRDMIYFCRASLAHAVNRGHHRIESEDIKQAEKEYSQYAFNSLEAETSAQLENLEELLYEFVGSSQIVTRKQMDQYFENAAIDSSRVQFGIDLLCESTFLGLETEKDHFEFIYDENRADIIKVLARKVVEITGSERYQINVPYHAFLEIRQATE
jgi:hypothetical protein